MLTDPIADMLSRIRNANRAMHDTAAMPTSRMKEEIARLLHDGEALDVALVLEEACDLLLHARGRHLGGVVHRLVGVANAGQHVCNWVSEHSCSRKMRDGRDDCRHGPGPNLFP